MPDPKEIRHWYHQAHAPVREQSEATGHAVRAVYLYSGMADVARLTGDEAMYAACKRLWDNIVKEKLYITGGIGATHLGEAFSFGYDLPNDTAYSETCAAIGLAFFARRMLELQADRSYGDVMEQALYNTVLAGMALDGKSFFYVNPLEVLPEACEKDERKHHVKAIRQKWFGCACCPPNIARIVSSIGAYIYTHSESTLYTHLYAGNKVSCTLNGTALDMELESGFPWCGEVKALLHMESPVTGTLAFRVSGWCRRASVEVRRNNMTLSGCSLEQGEIRSAGQQFMPGRGVEMRTERGYLYLTGEWQDGDELYLDFPMEVRCMEADPKVREDVGKVAFMRGPVCYCLEEADNGKNLHLLRADMEKIYGSEGAEKGCGEDSGKAGSGTEGREESEKDRGVLPGIKVETYRELGHEMRILKVPGRRLSDSAEGEALYREAAPAAEQPVTMTYLPYYAWNNRGQGEMTVWVRR